MTKRILSRICTCGICLKQELTDKAYLPDGWLITWEYPTTFCPDCLQKFINRFGEPEYWMKGGQKDIL